MARVTIASCLDNKNIDNKFELVVISFTRAKALEAGDVPSLPEADYIEDNKRVKTHVIALREIELDTISIDEIKESIKLSLVEPSNRQNVKLQVNRDYESSPQSSITEHTTDNGDNEFYISDNYK
jgi:DNA-directed RNA polymerase omega subunit